MVTLAKRETLKATAKAFLSNTSMHGLKYVAEDKRNVLERSVWLLVFGLGLGASFYLCFIMWIKYDTSPAIVTVETIDHPLGQVEFPSVTVCSQNKISRRKLDHVMRNSRYSNISVDDLMFTMRVMIKIDSAFNRTSEVLRVHDVLTANGLNSTDLVSVALQTMVNCQDMLVDCHWLNEPKPCSELFVLVPTDDGLCCGFNHLEPTWRPDHQKTDVLELNEPKRIHLPGIRMGLNVIVDANLDDVAATTARSNGFKVLIHNARVFPDVSERGFSISPGLDTYAGIEPLSSYTTPDVDRLPIDKRRCFNDFENPLQFYANYSSSRCMMECLTRKMIDLCNCRPYYYTASAKDPVCALQDYVCLSQVNTDFRLNGSFADCPCQPACDDLWFKVHLSLASSSFESVANLSTLRQRRASGKADLSARQFREYVKKNVAAVNVFYNAPAGILYRTDVRYGIEDFVSAMGGALGLGFGVSFISVVEILYFFAVRYYFGREEAKMRPVPRRISFMRLAGAPHRRARRSIQRRAHPLGFSNGVLQ